MSFDEEIRRTGSRVPLPPPSGLPLVGGGGVVRDARPPATRREAETALYEREAGRRLYWRWCGDPDGVTDRARYFDRMNPADSRNWQRLAMELEADAAKEGRRP